MTVLIIDIDSLRPDHLGCYGYDAPTSPQIDAFAEEAVRFDRMYVANSPCMPSRAGLVSGRYGVHNGIVTHGPRAQVLNSFHTRESLDGPREDWFTLPEVFFEEHIHTAAVSSFPRHPAPWFYHVWDAFHQPREPPESERGYPEYFQTPRAPVVADLAIDLLEGIADDPFFAYVQFWDPHTPYNRSEDEVERFRQHSPLPPYPTPAQIADHQDWDAYLDASEMPHRVRPGSDVAVTDQAGLQELIALYDAEIRYVDAQIGRILDTLRALDMYDETLVIVTADHAEEFGEHGLYGCHWSVYEGTQRIPLLVKPPATETTAIGARDELVTNVDLPRTIVDYAGLEVPPTWQGRSLRPVVESSSPSTWRDAIVLEHGLVTAQRAIRTDEWKLIRTYHPGMWDGVIDARELYAIEDDPWEQSNVADDHPGLVDTLDAEMDDWVKRHRGPDPDSLRAVADGEPELYKFEKDNYAGV